MTKEFYQILEINENATAEEIKKAYRKLALKWHPDKWSTKSLEERAKANEEMQKINKAYEVLGDEEKKEDMMRVKLVFSQQEIAKVLRNMWREWMNNMKQKEKILKKIRNTKKDSENTLSFRDRGHNKRRSFVKWSLRKAFQWHG